MPKITRINNKLYLPIPESVQSAMGIADGDDMEFLKHKGKSVILAKKDYLVQILEGANIPEGKNNTNPSSAQLKSIDFKLAAAASNLDASDIALLKKLDTLRYAERTPEKVNAIISPDERQILKSLIERKIVVPFSKSPSDQKHYSISKEIYDNFLYRNKDKISSQIKQKQKEPQAEIISDTPSQRLEENKKRWDDLRPGNYLKMLESTGYLVIKNESEAAEASAELESSIRQGHVVGTRAFDRKFYICLKNFLNKNAAKITRAIGDKKVSAQDLAKDIGMDIDAVKVLLYLLAESGETIEIRRDIFKLA